MKYWMMKTEPNEFSIGDLERKNTGMWDGVRNYQARNMMRDDMSVGDLVLVYHSNSGEETGVAGIAKISKESYPDPTQFDKKNIYSDPKSDPTNPRWLCVDVTFVEKFKEVLTLKTLKSDSKLAEFRLVKKGNRLSILPVSKIEFDYIVALAKS